MLYLIPIFRVKALSKTTYPHKLFPSDCNTLYDKLSHDCRCSKIRTKYEQFGNMLKILIFTVLGNYKNEE